MFVDEVDIHVTAGDGGHGCLSFRREKSAPRGGPDGGDGGVGGSIYLVASPHLNTLVNYRFHPSYAAPRGAHGSGSTRTGRNGRDLDLEVPAGTVAFEHRDDALVELADLVEPGQRVVVARGGRGGRGNRRFVSATNQAPRRTEPGRPGEQRRLRLRLKLLADVGLVGFPNAGKSTLIARISAARPKIADYPFTTLSPNLGVVDLGDDRSFVVADVPGLIAGAHAGHGLGDRFLAHLERTRVLVHLVDVSSFSGRDPCDDFDVVSAASWTPSASTAGVTAEPGAGCPTSRRSSRRTRWTRSTNRRGSTGCAPTCGAAAWTSTRSPGSRDRGSPACSRPSGPSSATRTAETQRRRGAGTQERHGLPQNRPGAGRSRRAKLSGLGRRAAP